jgi:hypothetical protein
MDIMTMARLFGLSLVESLEARSFKLYEGNKGSEILKLGFDASCILHLEFNEKDLKTLDKFLKFL